MKHVLASLVFFASAASAAADNYGSSGSCSAYAHPLEGLSGEDTVFAGEKIGADELNLLITPTEVIGYEWSCERAVRDATGQVELLCAGSDEDLDLKSYSAEITLDNDTLTFAWRGRSYVLHRCGSSQLVPKPVSTPSSTPGCH
jgi:hypothetical protein